MRCLEYSHAWLIACFGRCSFPPRLKGVLSQSNPVLLSHKPTYAHYQSYHSAFEGWKTYKGVLYWTESQVLLHFINIPWTSHSEFLQEKVSFPISVLTWKFLIFHAACWDRLKKEPRITTVITTILNFELKFIHLAPVITEFEPNLTPPLFWRRFATTFLLPCASSITNTLSPHCCLPDALNFPPADYKKMTWLPFHCFLFIPWHQANKQE